MKSDKQQETMRRTESERVRVVERTQLSDRWARLEQVSFDYRRNDGAWQNLQREIYHRGHGAAVLLYNLAMGRLVLTRQFRFPAWDCDDDGFMLEVPAGIIESDNPVETICKETEEETGFIIDTPRFLFRAYASPGSITEQLHYFCASYEPSRRSGQGGGLAEEGEDIQVVEVDLHQAVAWIEQGKVIDAKTILLIQYAQLHVFNA